MKMALLGSLAVAALAGLLLAGCGSGEGALPPPVRQSVAATPTPNVIQGISATYAADEASVYLAAQSLVSASTTAPPPSTATVLSYLQAAAASVTVFDGQLAALAAGAPPNVAAALEAERTANEAVVKEMGAVVAAKTPATLATAEAAVQSGGVAATTAANAVKTDLGLPTCPTSITC
jgi:hypothetical protein